MRLWQRRAHPWIWLLIVIAVGAVLFLLAQHDPASLALR
jgi:hypothetical protein